MRYFFNLFYRISLLSSLVILFIVLFTLRASASTVLFEDNFNGGDSGKWTVPRNDCIPDEWSFDNDKYGIVINKPGGCVTETTPSDASWDNSFNDYIIDVDVEFVSGTDKNLAWRYENSSDWVDLHFIGPNVIFQRATLVDFDNIQPLNDGNVYHFKIEVEGNEFRVFYYDITNPASVSYMKGVDLSNTYLTGRPALQASVGADFQSEVWFDNFVVTSIDDTLDVPYFAQNDPSWENNQYDSIDATIGEVGCALSAATMTLGYHGINTLPNGAILNVDNLNNWLNQNPDGAWRNGLTSWGALMRLSRIMNANDSAFPILDYQKISPPDFAEIDRILVDEEDPLIFEENKPLSPSGVHFTTVTGVVTSAEEYSLLDPLDADRSSFLIPPDELISARYLFPTNTNLSYLILHVDEELSGLLINPSNNKLGKNENGDEFGEIAESLFDEGFPLVHDDDHSQVTGDPFWEFSVPDPKTGEYRLELNADESGWYEFELYAYDRDANVLVFKKRVFVAADYPTIFNLDYVQDGGDGFATLAKLVDFETLRNDVAAMQQLGLIRKNFVTKALQQFLNLAERFYPQRLSLTNRFLNIFERQLNRWYPRFIDGEAYEFLLEELDLLRGSL